MRDDRHPARGVSGLLLGERPAHRRAEAERGEEVGRHPGDLFAFGRAGIADHRGAAPVHRNPRQRVEPATPLVVVGERAAVVRHTGLGIRVGDGDQIGGVRKRQRAQQHAVDDGEDVSADPTHNASVATVRGEAATFAATRADPTHNASVATVLEPANTRRLSQLERPGVPGGRSIAESSAKICSSCVNSSVLAAPGWPGA